ncbi:MAG: efflux RND transporter permease subunit, partial [Myxococcota bacterium]|nr:efflux RND transporter permease subunit [Myxococcota bacterium]
SSVTVRVKEGYSFFSIKFESLSDQDFDAAYQDLKDKVGAVSLPEETEEPFWLNFTSQDFVPMVQVVIHGTLPRTELYDLAERVTDDIRDIRKVGKIEVGGVQPREIRVAVDPDALQAYNLSILAISQALSQANSNIPGGLVTVGRNQFLLRTVGAFDSVAEIGEVIVSRSPGGGLVRVSDLAEVEDDWRDARVYTRFDGHPAVTLSVSKQPGGNSVAIIEQIREIVDRYNSQLEGGPVRLSISSDSSIYIRTMLTDLQANAAFGMILIVVILWLFLGLRNALLTALGVPLAFLATFVFMWATGETLNGNSLFGLVLVLGIIVDDAIVLVENATRHRSMGKGRAEAVIDGVGEVTVPIVAAILTTIAAFLPLMLMPGTMGKFMRIIPIVVAMALAASLVEALLSLPVHIHEWGEQDPAKLRKRAAGFRRFVEPYLRALRWTVDGTLPRPPAQGAAGDRAPGIFGGWMLSRSLQVFNLVGLIVTGLLFSLLGPGVLYVILGPEAAMIGVTLVFIALTVGAITLVVRRRLLVLLGEFWETLRQVRWSVFAAVYLGMIPLAIGIVLAVEQDLFGGEEIPQAFVRVRMPEGTPLAETDRVIREMEKHARAAIGPEEINSITSHAGLLMTEGEWFLKASVGQLILDFAQTYERERRVDDILASLRPQLALVPGPDSLEIRATEGGPPVGGDIELKVQGEDLDRLLELAEIVEAEMAAVPGVLDIRNDWVLGKSEVRVRVDEDRAALLGIPERDVGLAVRMAFDGLEATHFLEGDDEVPVIVRYGEAYRQDRSRLRNLAVPGPGGRSVPISDLADFETGQSIDAIRRYKGQRTISIAANVDRNITTPIAATNEVRARLADFSERFPGYRIDYSGQFEEFTQSLESLLYLAVFGMLFVYLILGAQFRSFAQPLVIIGFTFPGALLGAAIALLITGNPATLATLYGVVALLGIVVNDSLVFISFMNQEREKGQSVPDAIIEAGRVRLRPIVLTTVTTVFGLLPMAIGLAGKSDAWAPMAATIVCGLLVATATTLFVIPPVYRCVADLEQLARSARDLLGSGPGERREAGEPALPV